MAFLFYGQFGLKIRWPFKKSFTVYCLNQKLMPHIILFVVDVLVLYINIVHWRGKYLFKKYALLFVQVHCTYHIWRNYGSRRGKKKTLGWQNSGILLLMY